MAEKVLVFHEAGVTVVELNRADARNALDTETVDLLRSRLREISSSSETRACMLTGVGTAFSAGADLKQRTRMTLDEQAEHTRGIRECADLLELLPVPTIVAVNGPAFAGGLEIAIAGDVRIASVRATFGFPEVKLGIFPGAGGPVRLPRLIGQSWARLMILEGEPIDATEALRIGLVQRVVPGERLMEEALSVARRIASYSPEGVQAAKQLMNRSYLLPYDEAVELSDRLRNPLNRTAHWEAGLSDPASERNDRGREPA